MEQASKSCTVCGETKPLDAFHRRPERPNGDGRSSRCKDCFNRIGREKYHSDPRRKASQMASAEALKRRNRDFVWDYLSSHPCVDCGEADRIVLDFDHVRGEKERDISKMVASKATIERIIAEIEKCEVRCANCHRRRTAERAGWWQLCMTATASSPIRTEPTSSA